MKVKLFGSLRQYVGDKASVELAVSEPLAAREVIAALKIPDKSVYVVERGGGVIDKDTIVEDGEEIKLLPVIAGG